MAETLDASDLDRLAALREGIQRFVGERPWSAAFRPTPDDGWYVLSDCPDDPHSVAMASYPEVALYIAELGNAAPALIALARAGLAAQAEVARLSRILNELERAVDAALEAAAFAQKRGRADGR